MSIEILADHCAEVLRVRPSALLTDIDGTISDIAPTPDAAVLAPGAREALQRLTRSVDRVGAISGRAVSSAARMIDTPHLLVIGNHGFEWLIDGESGHVPGADRSAADIGAALGVVRERLAEAGIHDGIVIEDKRFTGSIHYRLTAEPEVAGQAIMRIAAEVADQYGLRLSPGRMVVEVRPPMVVTKGTAIEQLVQREGLASIVFLGDDVTDIDGFRAVSRLRERDGVSGLSVAVAGPDAIADVAANADVTVGSVAECVALLAAVGELLEAEA